MAKPFVTAFGELVDLETNPANRPWSAQLANIRLAWLRPFPEEKEIKDIISARMAGRFWGAPTTKRSGADADQESISSNRQSRRPRGFFEGGSALE
jgi:hypothetical protein